MFIIILAQLLQRDTYAVFCNDHVAAKETFLFMINFVHDDHIKN